MRKYGGISNHEKDFALLLLLRIMEDLDILGAKNRSSDIFWYFVSIHFNLYYYQVE